MCVCDPPSVSLRHAVAFTLNDPGPSRSTASACRAWPTMKPSVPSGMLGAASDWKFSGGRCYLQRCMTHTWLRTPQTRRADSCADPPPKAREASGASWRVLDSVCPRKLRQLPATETSLWVFDMNHSTNRTNCLHYDQVLQHASLMFALMCFSWIWRGMGEGPCQNQRLRC